MENMVIDEVKALLSTSAHPVARVLHKNDHFKVLILGFNKGMILKDHKAHLPTKLTVLEGSVIYNEEGRRRPLLQYAEFDIPVNVMHSVEASEDSLCLLTQG